MNKEQSNEVPQQKAWSIAIVVRRILGFPFFASLAFIGAMAMWLRWIWNFAKYGGEAIAYTNKMNRKTIQDVFQKLTENNK